MRVGEDSAESEKRVGREGGVRPSPHDACSGRLAVGVVLTPSERTLRARLVAHVLHASVDSRVHTKPARRAFMARFEDQVDPDRISPAQRARRAEHAKKAYFIRLALKSAQARRRS